MSRAVSYFYKGNRELCISDLKKALEIDPNNPTAQKYLQWILSNK